MKKSIGVVREIFLGLIRSRGFVVIWILAILFTCYSHGYYSFREGLYSYAQLNAAKGLEVLMLAMLMTGHRIVRWMQEDGVLEVYSSVYRGRMILAHGQMIAAILLAAFATVLIMLYDAVTALTAGAPWEWLGISLWALVLQFFLPLLICVMAGMCAAYWIKNRAAYGVILLFWCLTGSLSDKIFGYLILSGIVPSPFWGQVLNLGVQDAGTQMMDFNGGPLRELPRWVVKIGYALWLMLLYWESSVHSVKAARHGVYRFAWKPLAAALLILPMMVGFRTVFGDFFTNYSSTMRGQIYMSELYSRDEKSLTDEVNRSRDDRVKVLKNELTVSTGMQGLRAVSVQTMRAEQDIEEQCFTLYRGLKIREILLNGNPMHYTQSKDAVYVRFPETMQEGQSFELSFEYAGKTLPQVKANEYTVQLRSEFPWFPWPGLREENQYIHAFMDADQVGQDDVEYVLHYLGPKGLFVNLTEVGDGEYRGHSDCGITIYSGMVKKSYEDLQLYLPPALYAQADGYYHLIRDELDMYGSMKNSVGWLLGEDMLDQAWERYGQVDTAYIIQDLIHQESGTKIVKGTNLEVRFVGAGPASTAAMQASGNYYRREKDVYQAIIQKACEMAGLTKAEMSDGKYAFFGTYLLAYCQYRDGRVEPEGLKDFLREGNDYTLKLMPGQAETVAKLWTTAPRDEMDSFFRDWFEKLRERKPPYDCLIGDEVFAAMTAWVGEGG